MNVRKRKRERFGVRERERESESERKRKIEVWSEKEREIKVWGGQTEIEIMRGSLCVRKRDREVEANKKYFPQMKIIPFNEILNN